MQQFFKSIETNLASPKNFIACSAAVYCIILLPLSIVQFHWQFVADDLTLLHAAQVNPFPIFGDWIHSHSGLYRPLVILSFFLNFTLCGYSPFSFYLVNILLHLVATLSVALLGRKLFHYAELHYSHVWSFWLGVIFLISPQNLQNVLWISGRTDVLCGMFLFASILTLIKYIESSSKYFFALFVVFQIAAFMSKETAIVILLYVLLVAFIMREKKASASAYKILLPPVTLTALYLIFRATILTSSMVAQLGELSLGLSKILKLALYGAWALTFPIDLLDGIAFFEWSRVVTVVVGVSIIIAAAVIVRQIVYNRGDNIRIGALSIGLGFASLIIYLLNFPQMRLMYMHYPFILIGIVYAMSSAKRYRPSVLASVVILHGLLLLGVFTVVSRYAKINNYVLELYKALPDKDEYQPQKQYILLSGLGRMGQSYGIPNIQYMASLKLRGDLEERNQFFSIICYYETHSLDPLHHTGEYNYVNPITIEVKATHGGSVLVPSASKKFNFADSLFYSEISKNIQVIPREMGSLRGGTAKSCTIVFNDRNLLDDVEVLHYEDSKFTRKPLKSFIADLQGKKNR